MGYNPFLPTAGARINVLCVPAGPVTPDRFQEFIKLLQNAAVVKLEGGNAIDARDTSVFFDISASQDGRRADMFPFEINGRAQVLLGLIDSERVGGTHDTEAAYNGTSSTLVEQIQSQFAEQQTLSSSLLVRQLIVFHTGVVPDSQNDLLFFHEDDGKEAALQVVNEILRQWQKRTTELFDDFRDKPISMVPVGSSQTFPRGPKPNPTNEGTSTPVSAKASSPLPAIRESSAQSETSRGRFNIIQGMYKLQSGQWLDALKSLSDGAAIAFENQDHLWHGKALESLLVSMLFLSWAQVTYTVPQVCRSLPNRSGIFGSDSSAKSGASLKGLAQLIPPLVETILELYGKVSNLDLGGSLQDLLRESRVRHVNLLVAVRGVGCVLNPQTLEMLVLGDNQDKFVPSPLEGEFVSVSKAGLANILIDTLQTSQSSNNLWHYTSLLVAVASSLSILGLDRKHAFYLKQLMQQFAPKLIEARKVGASEVGVHPAAGLPPLSNALQGIIPEMVIGTRIMLSVAAGAYGAPSEPVPIIQTQASQDISLVHKRLSNWAAEHASGDVLLKIEMLRTCVNVCEALPDIPAGLHFASSILRSAKQSITMPKFASPQVPIISAEEQVSFVDSMKRAISAASRLGAHGCLAEYWDDFLVRDVQIFERDTFSKLIAHKPSDLSIRASRLADAVRDPFIYNPFTKDISVTSAPVLVEDEMASFAVVLQNPLEIEVEIEEVCLITKGVKFEPTQHNIVLGPFSAQVFTLNGKAIEDGDLEIIGCRAKIHNCYRQDFFIFKDDWMLPVSLKQKAGGNRGQKSKARLAAVENSGDIDTDIKPPIPSSLKLKVIGKQPRLVVQSSTLDSSSIMLLEGESRAFTLTLANESREVNADLILLTTDDSVTTRLQEALTNKALSPSELFEIQSQMATRPAIYIDREKRAPSNQTLKPGETRSYLIKIVGRPGLVNATVQADFAYLGVPSTEVKHTFYTRQIKYPINVTVNGSIEIPRCNFLPIQNDFAWSTADFQSVDSKMNIALAKSTNPSKLHHWLNVQTNASDFCMLSIDLRNVWPQPLDIKIQAHQNGAFSSQEEDHGHEIYTVYETLQPGIVTRVVLLVPRLFVADPFAAIPNLDTQKQFVVSTSKLSPEAEASSRESFWYREELLKCLHGTWTEQGSSRNGEIDLRKGIRLNARMVDVLRLDHVEIDYTLTTVEANKEDSSTYDNRRIKQLGKSHFVLPSETFATLKVRVRNRTQDTLRLLLRLQPAIRNQPHNIALDLSKRLAWSGVLQSALHPALDPGGVCEAELGIIALAAGEYEINASVEEIKGRIKSTRKSSNVITSDTGRRIWHARPPFQLDAFDFVT